MSLAEANSVDIRKKTIEIANVLLKSSVPYAPVRNGEMRVFKKADVPYIDRMLSEITNDEEASRESALWLMRCVYAGKEEGLDVLDGADYLSYAEVVEDYVFHWAKQTYLKSLVDSVQVDPFVSGFAFDVEVRALMDTVAVTLGTFDVSEVKKKMRKNMNFKL